jgi:hypothetical protein
MGQKVRAVASSMRGVKHRPKEFMEMNNFIEVFSQKINLIGKISQRIYKEEREYFDEMKVSISCGQHQKKIWLTLSKVLPAALTSAVRPLRSGCLASPRPCSLLYTSMCFTVKC